MVMKNNSTSCCFGAVAFVILSAMFRKSLKVAKRFHGVSGGSWGFKGAFKGVSKCFQWDFETFQGVLGNFMWYQGISGSGF